MRSGTIEVPDYHSHQAHDISPRISRAPSPDRLLLALRTNFTSISPLQLSLIMGAALNSCAFVNVPPRISRSIARPQTGMKRTASQVGNVDGLLERQYLVSAS